MALHRRAAKRDDNEPGIRSRFKFHGWHTETLSASGMPDLMVFHVRAHASGMGFEPRTYLVDVKGKDGAPTKPQREKWAALAEKGIPVYVVRAEADVDALVRGELEPWRPEPKCDCGYIVGRLKTNGGHKATCATRAEHTNADAALADLARRYAEREDTLIAKRAAAELKRRGLTRTQPVDAAKEAAETFAPPPEAPPCTYLGCAERAAYGYLFCEEQTP
jgi:hypothetical protein